MHYFKGQRHGRQWKRIQARLRCCKYAFGGIKWVAQKVQREVVQGGQNISADNQSETGPWHIPQVKLMVTTVF